jgi:hypothetical protein
MTLNAMQEYSPFFMEGWQYKAAFVIQSGRRPTSSIGAATRVNGQIDNLLEKPIE